LQCAGAAARAFGRHAHGAAILEHIDACAQSLAIDFAALHPYPAHGVKEEQNRQNLAPFVGSQHGQVRRRRPHGENHWRVPTGQVVGREDERGRL